MEERLNFNVASTDIELYGKQAKNLKEGDIVRLSTGDGMYHYYMDTDAYYLTDERHYEVWFYGITEEELDRYFKNSDISFRDVTPTQSFEYNPRMDLWNLGSGVQYVTCVEPKKK